jgi:hypothetical protein
MLINPTLIEMPPDFKPLAQGVPNKKPKLKIRRKGGAKKEEQIEKANSSPNGIRNEDEEQSNKSDDLTGEDYEKLAKLLQVRFFVFFNFFCLDVCE